IVGDLGPPPAGPRRRRRRLRRHPIGPKVARDDPGLAVNAVLVSMIGAEQVAACEAAAHRLTAAGVTFLRCRLGSQGGSLSSPEATKEPPRLQPSPPKAPSSPWGLERINNDVRSCAGAPWDVLHSGVGRQSPCR